MLNFTPPVTIDNFMRSPALAKFCIGPLGSGKSTGCIMELLQHACEQEPDAKGVRPTRYAIIRNTTPQLRQTCLADIQQLLGEVANYKAYLGTIYFNIDLPDGTKVNSEWLLLPIDTKEDTRRLLSLQLTGAWIEEFRETDYNIVAAVLGRVGRYPSPTRVKPTWQGIIGSSNPMPMGSEWYERLVMGRPVSWGYFAQPGGMDPEAENVENLPDGYYERLLEGHDQDWIDVHVHGKYGPDMSGRPVFYSSFKYDVHTTSAVLSTMSQSTLIIAFDYGRTPCALLAQQDATGRLIIYKEITSENMGLEQFVREKLRPTLADPRFSRLKMVCTGDPAGTQKTQVNDISPVDVLKGAGFIYMGPGSNLIAPRLKAVESLLLQNRMGKPALLISKDGCPTLVRAMVSGYRFKRMKTGRVDDKPDKNEFSHIADALQYLCMSINSNIIYRADRLHFNPLPPQQQISDAAWT